MTLFKFLLFWRLQKQPKKKKLLLFVLIVDNAESIETNHADHKERTQN